MGRRLTMLTRACSNAVSRWALVKSSSNTYLQMRFLHGNQEKLDIFDRVYKRRQRDRAAWLMGTEDPLLDIVTENLLDRLEDCKRSFHTALNMGGAVMHVKKLLKGRGGVEKLVNMDISHDMIKKSMELSTSSSNIENYYIVGDEEFLPFKAGSLDLIVSVLGLHWVNDLPRAMAQCRTALKPDGMFLAAMLGGETLRELRISCTLAEMERQGGISPRVSPLVQVQDAGNLLTGAGFAIPTVDTDKYIMRYPSALELIDHLRSMGECNAVSQRVKSLRRETAIAAAAIYDSMFGDSDGIMATFQVIYLAGWRPHPSQQSAKKRGSATVSFEDIQKVFGDSQTEDTK
ncbi:hypothetical protein KP509_29G020400 [Ceratopteris richardii]|uniref:Methyltransferase type 11 domain-containing protein n=1 Tax=Ceratopteris richardii TaxID=49495 RepID=A0A8T2R7G3_CERRI|nr:hypothetical protein KP509_29G020400 [Ceratopteris richardii]